MAALKLQGESVLLPRGSEGEGGRENVNVCPETEPCLRHPRLPLSLIKHFLVFLYKMESKPAPPNAPSLGWLNKWGCLGHLRLGPDWRRQIIALPASGF